MNEQDFPVDVAYAPRLIDGELSSLIQLVPAIALEGPKGVGKTSACARIAKSVFYLDDPVTLEVLEAAPERLTSATPPVLIDEWQRWPRSWDLVRRSVDQSNKQGRFLLTGSTSLDNPETHSGSGRIVDLRMRPMSLFERGFPTTVSLAKLLSSEIVEIVGSTSVGLENYITEILGSGLPGLQGMAEQAKTKLLQTYVNRIVDRDIPETGLRVRNPALMRRWLTAFAAATSTIATFETIRDAATAGNAEKPARSSTNPYRDSLERIWISDPLPGWAPTHSQINRLTFAPKHHLADPGFAAAILNLDAEDLIEGKGTLAPISRPGSFLGSLFESLAALNLRVYAQNTGARVSHLRTKSGEREVDFIVEGSGGKIVAIEAKLSATVTDSDVRHLNWLGDQVGNKLKDKVILTTGTDAYRRKDGVAVVPLSLLGP